MPSINIKEIDNTIFSSVENDSDNIVFIPGAAITGPNNEPTLCTSYNEFITKFGSAPVINSATGTSWDMATNLLLRGFSVLYYRVVPTSGVAKATADLNGIVVSTDSESGETTESEVPIGTVTELYGGSGGNDLSYRIVKTATSAYFRVYSGASHRQIESTWLYDLGATEDDDKTAFINAIGTKLTTSYVEVTLTTPAVEFNKVAYNAQDSFASMSGGTDATDSAIKAEIPATFDTIKDKYLYDVKFITSGGYTDPTSTSNGINSAMVALATTRGDCTAFIDVPFGTPSSSVYNYFNGNFNTSYAAAYAPWSYMRLEVAGTKWMSPSFVFLYTLARSINSGNKIWNPPAGVNRATVPTIVETEYEIGSGLLDAWQNDSNLCINPIMKLRQYGYVIYGQRTLYNIVNGDSDAKSVLQELGIRLIANEIKKLISNVAISLTFERNNLHTWNEFRGRVEPTLIEMKADGGIIDYQIVMDATTVYPSDVSENKIKGVVRVSIARAAEDFEIGFELNDSSVTFNE